MLIAIAPLTSSNICAEGSTLCEHRHHSNRCWKIEKAPPTAQKCCPLFLATGTRKEGNKTGVVCLPPPSGVKGTGRRKARSRIFLKNHHSAWNIVHNRKSQFLVRGGVGRWDDLFSPLHPATSSLFVYERILLKANISDKRGENKHPNRTSFHRCEQWHSRRSICCQTQVDWALCWRYSNCDSPFLRLLHLCLPSLCGDVLSRARLRFVVSSVSCQQFPAWPSRKHGNLVLPPWWACNKHSLFQENSRFALLYHGFY